MNLLWDLYWPVIVLSAVAGVIAGALFLGGLWERPVYALVFGTLAVSGALLAPLLGQSLLPDFKERDFLMHWVTAPGTSHAEEVALQGRQVKVGWRREHKDLKGLNHWQFADTTGSLVDQLGRGHEDRPVHETTLWLVLAALGDSLLGAPMAAGRGFLPRRQHQRARFRILADARVGNRQRRPGSDDGLSSADCPAAHSNAAAAGSEPSTPTTILLTVAASRVADVASQCHWARSRRDGVSLPQLDLDISWKITWDHLLRQTSDWSGTLWGKPDWADRPLAGPVRLG